MNVYLLTALALVVYLILVWFLGTLLGLKSPELWILRGGLALVGIAAAAVFLWFWTKKLKQEAASGGGGGAAGGGAPDDLDLLLRDAEARLTSSPLAPGAKFSNRPVIFLVGASGASKTTAMLHSGLEPELLAGQVYQGTSIIPTRAVNLWFARQAVFIEAGGGLLSDPSIWTRLVRRMRPGKLQSVVKTGEQAPRAAVVCLECESLVQPGAIDAATAAARSLGARLLEISRQLGISLPVYVLFTKVDRIAFFHDYVHNLTNEETTQVVGVTLPVASGQPAGVYAERETVRLTDAFQNLYCSLCDKRTEFLARESDAAKLPGIYEFPREFRKLRGLIVQFLVDLCRPSQLTVGPFLRGFYFCGVRPVILEDVAAAPAAGQQQPLQREREATGMFKMGPLGLEKMTPTPVASIPAARRAPQWVFLHHFFNDVLLADRAALGASGASVRTNSLRRILLASAAGLCLLLSIAFIVSYAGNRGLESSVLNAAAGIPASEAGGANLPSVDALNRLETLRQALETLTRYEREGAPWSLRWGLYAGSDLYPHVRRTYFNRFRQLLFGSTQDGLLQVLKVLPGAPGPSDDYGYAYDTLKGYLITTSHHDKSTQLFLSPLLRNRWMAGRNVDPERSVLAQKQFDFYSEELKYANPFSSENDSAAIERARKYLLQFAGTERVYQFMVTEANKANKLVNFNQRFPGSAEVVVNNRDVPGAFTKGGWAFMQNAIKNADRYFSGEQWVLGGQQAGFTVDRANLEQQLRNRYYGDFINQWRDYLKRSAVVRYSDIRDAAKKLNLTSGPQSPLLAMFWLASQNTGVDAPEVLKALKPLHTVMPPASVDQYVGPSNADYMKSLVGLQVSLEQVASQPGVPNEAAAGQTLASASSAHLVTRQMAQSFGIDPDAHLDATVQKLMEDPITYTEALLRRLGPAELNGKGKDLCAQLRALMSKYPFNPASSAKATLEEVAVIFRPPQGALWTFYDQNLQKLLPRQGNLYVQASGGGITLSPGFVGFFNRAAAFANALYPGGSQAPRLTYTLRQAPTADIDSLRLIIDGQTADYSAANATAKQFFWPGPSFHEVKLTGKFKGGSDFNFPSYDGLWAAFEFFGDADKWQSILGGGAGLEWMLRGGRQGRPVTSPSSGQPLVVRFDLDMGGAPPVFQKGYFAGLACVAEVAR